MKSKLIGKSKWIAAAIAVLVAGAGTASAAPYNINARQSQIEQRIDMGVRTGSLTRFEARSLRDELHQVQRLEARYRRDGLTRWERADLDRRLDVLSAKVRWERHDGQDRGYRR
jgi:polyisoprenoid-binding protein YceI